MPSPPVLTHFAEPDPRAAPLNLADLWALLNATVQSEIQGEYIPYIIGHATPDVDDQDKAWIELSSSGKPLAVKIFYNGIWRRIYNGMIGEIRMYSGPPGSDTDPTFDADGKGRPGKEYDGWQICNGKNGSPDLSDKFIVGAHMNKADDHPDFTSGWVTFVDGINDLKTGGKKNHMIVANNLPPVNPTGPDKTPPEAANKLIIHGRDWKDEDHSPDFNPLIANHYAGGIKNDWDLLTYGANPPTDPQKEVPTLPPFYALAFIIFKGY